MVETPERWLAVGERLVAAASLVWRTKIDPIMENKVNLTDYIVNDAMAYRHGFYVTAGFGLENFSKGLLVARMLVAGKPVCEQGRTELLLVGSLKTHRLSKLAKDLSLPLTPSEERLVTRMENMCPLGRTLSCSNRVVFAAAGHSGAVQRRTRRGAKDRREVLAGVGYREGGRIQIAARTLPP